MCCLRSKTPKRIKLMTSIALPRKIFQGAAKRADMLSPAYTTRLAEVPILTA